MKNCESKVVYCNLEESTEALNRYYERVVLSIYPVVEYWCNLHQGYHLGHERPMSEIDQYRELFREIGYYRAVKKEFAGVEPVRYWAI